MTIRKRLSRTNTRILLFALLSLLVIGVFIIEIFEKTYLEQAINYVKLQDHSVEPVSYTHLVTSLKHGIIWSGWKNLSGNTKCRRLR